MEVLNEAFADPWDFVPVRREKWLYWTGSSRFRPELALLATSGDEIAGFCLCEINEERIRRLGEKRGTLIPWLCGGPIIDRAWAGLFSWLALVF